ncbi:17587_t:CDS:2, partial [Racocetra fulgida]
ENTQISNVVTNNKMEKSESKNTITKMSLPDELTKFRQLWWDQGNMHPKANWENTPLPYELKSNVSWDQYAERTDKHNVHGMWEWKNGKVFVYELPAAPHESACAELMRSLNFALAGVYLTDYDFVSLGSMS